MVNSNGRYEELNPSSRETTNSRSIWTYDRIQVHNFLVPGSKRVRIEDVVEFWIPTLVRSSSHLLLRRHRWGSPRQGKDLAQEVMLVRIAYSTVQDLAHSYLKILW